MASVSLPKRRRLSSEAALALLWPEVVEDSTDTDTDADTATDADAATDTATDADTNTATALTLAPDASRFGKRFACPIPRCSGAYNYENNLKMHVRKMHPETYFKCKQCYRAFIDKASFDDHECRPNLTVPCPTCGKPYSSKKSLWYHRKVAHQYSCEEMIINIECPMCQQVYSTAASFRSHVRRQHNTTPRKLGISLARFARETRGDEEEQ
jgi:hypothetical protein